MIAVVFMAGHDNTGAIRRGARRRVLGVAIRERAVNLGEVTRADEAAEDPAEGRDEVLLAYFPYHRLVGRDARHNATQVRGEGSIDVLAIAAVKYQSIGRMIAVQPCVEFLVEIFPHALDAETAPARSGNIVAGGAFRGIFSAFFISFLHLLPRPAKGVIIGQIILYARQGHGRLTCGKGPRPGQRRRSVLHLLVGVVLRRMPRPRRPTHGSHCFLLLLLLELHEDQHLVLVVLGFFLLASIAFLPVIAGGLAFTSILLYVPAAPLLAEREPTNIRRDLQMRKAPPHAEFVRILRHDEWLLDRL
mmetsp:Transcript_17044/g.40869  ORF Transcript_17044/g.40869 Transcript_17044/m.40869 type:complete len:304 (-) Transcript_17044:3103-4014(-)